MLAIQELRGDLRALRDTMHFLGSDWAFLMTDVTQGGAGNSERLAFLYDRTRVHPSGLACELVVPPERLSRIGPDLLISQFARTPYAVSFKRKNTTFILTTLHVLFGSAPSSRIGELKEIADWMGDWAKRSHRFEHNLLTLGDFNIDRTGSPLYDAFVSTGLTIPTFLLDQPRTIFDDPGDSSDDNFYDQIAWFTTGSRSLINMTPVTGGNFDFMPHVYGGSGLSRNSVSYRISDHYPLWIEFLLD